MQHDDAEKRMRDALSRLPLEPDPADAFAALDKALQPDLWPAWVSLQRRVAAEAPEELHAWACGRIAAASWLNTLLHDVHLRVREEMAGDTEEPELPEGAEECMQQVHNVAQGLLSALVLTTLDHVQEVLETAASGQELPPCPACALEARLMELLRVVLAALDEYHLRQGQQGSEEDEEEDAR